MEGWMLLPHCLWDCSGRATIRTFPAGSVPWGRSCWFFKCLKNRFSSIAIANANTFNSISIYANNLTWQSCIHSSIPPSTWDLSDGENSSQSWLVDNSVKPLQHENQFEILMLAPIPGKPHFLINLKHPWWRVSARALPVVGIARCLALDVVDEQHQQHKSNLNRVISFKGEW